MNWYLQVVESLFFLLKHSKSDIGKSLIPVLKSFIHITSILFKYLAKSGFGNSIHFHDFSLLEFSFGDKIASFLLKYFYHDITEEVEGAQVYW